jgi:hypothetical protein
VYTHHVKLVDYYERECPWSKFPEKLLNPDPLGQHGLSRD